MQAVRHLHAVQRRPRLPHVLVLRPHMPAQAGDQSAGQLGALHGVRGSAREQEPRLRLLVPRQRQPQQVLPRRHVQQGRRLHRAARHPPGRQRLLQLHLQLKRKVLVTNNQTNEQTHVFFNYSFVSLVVSICRMGKVQVLNLKKIQAFATNK